MQVQSMNRCACSILNNFFASCFTTDDGIRPNLERKSPIGVNLGNVYFHPELVLRAIKRGKSKTSRTPDGLPSLFFKKLAEPLCVPLAALFELSFESGTLPSAWRTAEVIPLYKKGDPTLPENYRPVSLTSVACKIMERCIYENMLLYLRQNNLISMQQHGFLNRRSTCTQLLETTYDWCVSFDQGKGTDVVYIDFRKAFDSVSHPKLLIKLESYGIVGHLLYWLKAFLINRNQRVVLGSSISDFLPVTSGVPQGSILGPLLFILYINDMPEVTGNVTTKMFADDVKLYSQVSVNRNDIQEALNNLLEWSAAWQLKLAIPKCFVMHLSSKRNQDRIQYLLGATKLKSEVSARDLGITISSNLSFSDQCLNVAKKANKVTNMIFRGFIAANREMLVKAFKIYVRPLTEYISPVWSPQSKKDINIIEKVQRYFTRRLFAKCGLAYVSYDLRLQQLGLERLELRRIRTDLAMCYQVVHGDVDLDAELYFPRLPPRHINNMRTRQNHPLKLYIKPNAKQSLKNHFFHRVVQIWNSLPAKINDAPLVTASKLHIFKKRLLSHDLNVWLRGEP